jgi:mono/diheme cytochrome c family protein
LSRASFFALAVLAALCAGCWEQVSRPWFAQMKKQPAVQPFEDGAPLAPPEGTIPFGGIEPRIDHPAPAFSPEAMALRNPIPASAASVARGKEVYGIHCAVCHGADGMANVTQVPVAARLAASGMPALPLVAVPGYTDGFLFTKIRYGKPGMPAYPQIPPEDRWHVVNYLRTLFGGPPR